MTMRKTEVQALDLKDRINELHNVRMYLRANYEELTALRKRLENGDKSVRPRVNELFDLIQEKKDWVERNVPIIKKQLSC